LLGAGAVIFIGLKTGAQSVVPLGVLLFALAVLAMLSGPLWMPRPLYGPQNTRRFRSLYAIGFLAFMPGILILVLIGHLVNLPGLWILSAVVTVISWGLAAIL